MSRKRKVILFHYSEPYPDPQKLIYDRSAQIFKTHLGTMGFT